MSAGEESKSEATQSNTVDSTATNTPLLDSLVTAFPAHSQPRAPDILKQFIEQVIGPNQAIGRDTEKTINLRIAEIDKLLSDQLNVVMHNPDFQKLEGSWRGLHYLVDKSETGTQMKIRVLNASKKDLLKDLDRASEFDQSALFQKVYRDEYSQFGGAPFGALIGDYEFGIHNDDMRLVERISEVAAAAHAPFVAAAGSSLLGMDSYTQLPDPRDLSKIFESPDHVKWRAFRDSEDSRYVGLTMPHVLMRLPYGPETAPVEAFNFQEDVDGKDHRKYLWGNAAYAFGTRLTESFAKYGWLATIRGVESGGAVMGLPTHVFDTGEGDRAIKCPTEIAIDDRRDKELSDLGFIPLSHCKNTDYAAFFSAQSCQKPRIYDRDDANANAQLSTRLQYLFCVSRFAHYLKSMARDKIGSFMEKHDAEVWLNRWVQNYCLPNPQDAGPEMRARRPLQAAKIEVMEVPGRPGSYQAVAMLRPHLQLEELGVSLRLVAELPKSAKG